MFIENTNLQLTGFMSESANFFIIALTGIKDVLDIVFGAANDNFSIVMFCFELIIEFFIVP